MAAMKVPGWHDTDLKASRPIMLKDPKKGLGMSKEALKGQVAMAEML